MPYIHKSDRETIDRFGKTPETVGELTYRLTEVVNEYMVNKPPRYQTYAEVLGALEATKIETYRRVISPYEDQKIAENGDVFTAQESDLKYP